MACGLGFVAVFVAGPGAGCTRRSRGRFKEQILIGYDGDAFRLSVGP